MEKISASMMPRDYEYNAIDLIKLLCAIMICGIHIPPIASGTALAETVNFLLSKCLFRLAVPFYFTASGFFLSRKAGAAFTDTGAVKNYCFRMLRLLGTWTFLLVSGGRYHLWYLGAAALAAVLLTVLSRAGIGRAHMAVIAVILYITGLLGDYWYGFLMPLKSLPVLGLVISGYEKLFGVTRNGVFFGFIFVLMGAVFAEKRIVLSRFWAVSGFIISVLCLIFEGYMLDRFSAPRDYNMTVSLLPAVFFLFYLATHIRLKSRPVYKKMRTVGVLVYFLHLLVYRFVYNAVKALAVYLPHISSFTFILTVAAAAALAALIMSASRRKRFRLLRYLYS